MIEARSEAVVPAPPATVFATATDLEHADWLPAVRGLRRLSGQGVGSRWRVEVGLLGRHLDGVLVCTALEPPRSAEWTLEGGFELTLHLTVAPVRGGSRIVLEARYRVTRPFGGALERASAGPARREVERAVEQLAARFGRGVDGKDGV